MGPGNWQHRLYAMNKAEIEEYAEAIRIRGFNLVRIHYPDGSLTGKNGYPKKPLTIDKVKLPRRMEELPIDKAFEDRWDYFVACLRKRNIYLLPDIVSARTAWTAATVDFDFKTGILFREDYRDNWRAGFHYMMLHVNPYTGTRMLDDPMASASRCSTNRTTRKTTGASSILTGRTFISPRIPERPPRN